MDLAPPLLSHMDVGDMKMRMDSMDNGLMPAGLKEIFYDEAKRISGDDAEAQRLTMEAIRGFLSHYSIIRRRSERNAFAGQ
jgi:hypothetical protein